MRGILSTESVFGVEQVSFAYEGGHVALEEVSLDVRTGESLVVLGANGSGKSTLLKLLDGLYFPSRGAITAFGNPLTEQVLDDEAANFAFRRRVGLVFQDTDVQLFSPSVLDEVAFAPLQLGLDQEEVERRVESSLQALGIEELRSRAPHRLSGGEKRKVALGFDLSLNESLARRMSLRPACTRAAHPGRRFIEAAAGWQTLVTATHDLSIVEKIATRVYLFDTDHHIAATGAPEEILGNHDLLHACNLVHYHLSAKGEHRHY